MNSSPLTVSTSCTYMIGTAADDSAFLSSVMVSVPSTPPVLTAMIRALAGMMVPAVPTMPPCDT